jgi:hypothetical protein
MMGAGADEIQRVNPILPEDDTVVLTLDDVMSGGKPSGLEYSWSTLNPELTGGLEHVSQLTE